MRMGGEGKGEHSFYFDFREFSGKAADIGDQQMFLVTLPVPAEANPSGKRSIHLGRTSAALLKQEMSTGGGGRGSTNLPHIFPLHR